MERNILRRDFIKLAEVGLVLICLPGCEIIDGLIGQFNKPNKSSVSRPSSNIEKYFFGEKEFRYGVRQMEGKPGELPKIYSESEKKDLMREYDIWDIESFAENGYTLNNAKISQIIIKTNTRASLNKFATYSRLDEVRVMGPFISEDNVFIQFGCPRNCSGEGGKLAKIMGSYVKRLNLEPFPNDEGIDQKKYLEILKNHGEDIDWDQ